MAYQPTPHGVREFWTYMTGEYRSEIVQKDDSALMSIAGSFLDMTSIVDKDRFMAGFVTTIGRTIYIPFEIGVATEQFSLWGQVRVCAHEHVHIDQGDRDGWLTFGAKYISSKDDRSAYEAEAYGADLELEHWRTPTCDLPGFARRRAKSILAYGCGLDQVVLVEQILLIRAGVIAKHGRYECRATKRAIAYLEGLR